MFLKLQVKLMNKIQDFFTNEEGAETVEYAAIAAVIVIAGAAAYGSSDIADIISSSFGKIESAVG